jgi:hypothetical protein
LAFIPGTQGIEIGGGSSAASSNGHTEGNTVMDSAGVTSTATSVGLGNDLDIQHWVTNAKGDHATAGFRTTNAASVSYDYTMYPGEGSVGWTGWVAAEQKLDVNSADYINAYAYASNAAGDEAYGNTEIYSGSLNGYFSSAYAGPASWLGIERGAFVYQTLDHASGDNIVVQTWANNVMGDNGRSQTEISNGDLYEYAALTSANLADNGLRAAGTQVYGESANAPYGSIQQNMWAYDNKGDWSVLSTSITNGNLVGNSLAYSISQWGLAESNQNINAKGNVIDVGAYAQNNKPGYEYLSYFDGTVKYYTAPGGTAEFEYKTSNELATNINSKATLDNVLITPTLPAGTKTAIVLEPMYYAFTTIGGATDLGPTVAQTLAEKEYAVLRYTDSGASIDKFQDLDNYNVALISSHMDNQHIDLSTYPGVVDATQLGAWYSNPPSNSLVILAGCESLGGFPSHSPLASAVNEADTIMGFSESVGTLWCNDYLSVLIKKMGEGMTAIEANNYVGNIYRYEWLAAHGYPTVGVVPLNGIGNKDFKL